MAFGSLATISVAKPRNLVIAVIDNGHYGETGMQTSHTGHGIDFEKVAAACGFAECATLTSIDEVETLSRAILEPAEGPRLLRCQGRGGKPAALAAASRCGLHQEPLPQPSRIRPQLRVAQ